MLLSYLFNRLGCFLGPNLSHTESGTYRAPNLEIASIGDASGAIADWAQARNEEFEGSVFGFPVENFLERIPGHAAAGTVEIQAAIRDGDELGRFAEGVVAITDAFEEATER